jgi:hypothetical protein
MLVCVVAMCILARETAGAARTRSSLRPFFDWANDFSKPRAHRAARMRSCVRTVHLRRHRPRRRTIQYSETFVMELKTRGVLDTRLRGYDGCGVAHRHHAESVIGRAFATRSLAMTTSRRSPERWHNQAFLGRRDERCSAGPAQDARGAMTERVKRFLSMPKMPQVSRGGTD